MLTKQFSLINNQLKLTQTAYILIFCFFSTIAIFAMVAARGSGTYTTRYRLYQPATEEVQGWGADSSTNSINNNFAIIDRSW